MASSVHLCIEYLTQGQLYYVNYMNAIYIHVCVGGWDTNQLTGINSPRTSAWETDSCWYAKVEQRGALGGYKEKKLATKS